MMVESISMQNILKTRKKPQRREAAGAAPPMGLSLNYKNIVTSFSSQTKNIDSKSRDPNWVTGVVDASGSFIVFIKVNSQSNKHLIRQVQAAPRAPLGGPMGPPWVRPPLGGPMGPPWVLG
nr:hypothetical protein [Morchella crassipes]